MRAAMCDCSGTCCDCNCNCLRCTSCDGCAGNYCSHCECKGESVLPLIAVVALVAVVLFALIGVLVGFFFLSIVLQRIFQRHLAVLRKQGLARVYTVMDLSAFSGDFVELQRPYFNTAELTSYGIPVSLSPEAGTELASHAPRPTMPSACRMEHRTSRVQYIQSPLATVAANTPAQLTPQKVRPPRRSRVDNWA